MCIIIIILLLKIFDRDTVGIKMKLLIQSQDWYFYHIILEFLDYIKKVESFIKYSGKSD